MALSLAPVDRLLPTEEGVELLHLVRDIADAELLPELCEYLNSPEVAKWLMAHCQRAANGFLRLQSHVLKALPLPQALTGMAVAAG